MMVIERFMYDSGCTDDLIVVRVDATSIRATEGGSKVTLSSPSMSDCSWKKKKDKKKMKKGQRRHSSISSSPGGKLPRHADRRSASPGRERG